MPNPSPVMTPAWHHLLFLHWPVPAASLRVLLPPGLELDTFGGQAYIGLVPFTMTKACPNWMPPLGPKLDNFHEVNVRTYVRVAGRDPGVWFFSLDAAHVLAVIAARSWYKLPYFFARIGMRYENDSIVYRSRRRWPAPTSASCSMRYTPCGDIAPAQPGSLEHFLVERYLLYSTAGGKLYRGRVAHSPYPLQSAKLYSLQESLIAAAGIARPATTPIIHYARMVQTDIFPLERVEN